MQRPFKNALAALAATFALSSTASAQDAPFNSVADFGLDQTVENELQAFANIVEALQTVQQTTEIGLDLFQQYADEGKMNDDLRLAMQNWQQLATMTWATYNGAMHNAESIIDTHIATHCDLNRSIVPVSDCVDALGNRNELGGMNIVLLESMQGLDLIQIAFHHVLD